MNRMLGILMLVLVSMATPRHADAQSSPAEIAILKNKAAAGDANAQYELGLAYRRGEGVPQNDTEAVKWYRLAAAQGVLNAQTNLGTHYQFGRGVPEDNTEAVKWYRSAAAQGHPLGQLNLGAMYYEGKGVPKDDVQAYMWLNLAAAGGDIRAVGIKNTVAKSMTEEQIAEAQRLSTAFKPTKAP